MRADWRYALFGRVAHGERRWSGLVAGLSAAGCTLVILGAAYAHIAAVLIGIPVFLVSCGLAIWLTHCRLRSYRERVPNFK
jgi:hypothetical protein